MYKIVKNKNGTLYSSNGNHSKYSVKYELNKWTYPSLGKLFVFGDLLSARKYYRICDDNFEMYKCEILGEPQKAPEWVPLNQANYELFWNGKVFNTGFCLGDFGNSYFVDAVKLIQKV